MGKASEACFAPWGIVVDSVLFRCWMICPRTQGSSTIWGNAETLRMLEDFGQHVDQMAGLGCQLHQTAGRWIYPPTMSMGSSGPKQHATSPTIATLTCHVAYPIVDMLCCYKYKDLATFPYISRSVAFTSILPLDLAVGQKHVQQWQLAKWILKPPQA